MSHAAVVVPTLNSAATLDWTLLSLSTLAARCRLDVVVVDSFSTDATPEICDRWGVRMIQVEPGNLYRAVNAGMRSVRARWITYLNSDDLFYADGFSALLQLGDAVKADLVYGSADFIDSSGRYLHSLEAAHPDEAGSLLRCMVMPFLQPAAAVGARAFEELGGFDETYKYSGDFDFFCRASLAGYKFARLRAPVAAFRLSPGQLSSREKGPLLEEGDAITRRLRLRPGLRDLWALTKWKIRNVPNYACRVLRHYQLTGALMFPRATEYRGSA